MRPPWPHQKRWRQFVSPHRPLPGAVPGPHAPLPPGRAWFWRVAAVFFVLGLIARAAAQPDTTAATPGELGFLERRVYRPNRPHQGVGFARLDDPTPGTRRPAPAELAFVEFDEQGDFWRREQLQGAVEHLRKLGASKVPVVLFVYVHGWHHDSTSADVERFRGLLQRLAASEAIRPAYPLPGFQPPRVCGVYLGWRGETLATPLLNGLSFRSRQLAAERFAGIPATETIFKLVAAARDNPDQEHSRSILIGHSFGALALERALAQAVVGGLLYRAPGAGAGATSTQVYAPADLVLLMNSAGRSLHAKELIGMMNRASPREVIRDGSPATAREPPLIVSVSSTGDGATRTAYPVSQFIYGGAAGALTGSFRRYASGEEPLKRSSQYGFYRQTPGNHVDLISHDLLEQGGTDPAKREVRRQSIHRGENGGFDDDLFRLNLGGSPTRMTFRGEAGARWLIHERPGNWNRSPYWVVEVPREVIYDHGDIFSNNAYYLAAALFRISRVLPAQAPGGRGAEPRVPPTVRVAARGGRAKAVPSPASPAEGASARLLRPAADTRLTRAGSEATPTVRPGAAAPAPATRPGRQRAARASVRRPPTLTVPLD